MLKSSILNNIQQKTVYYNKPQRMAMHVLANQEYHVWGRRTGKSFGLTGPRALQNVFLLPKSMGGVVGPSYKMLNTQILPNMIAAWGEYGLKEDVHFVVNKRPPVKWKWPKPYLDPKVYDNTIYFFNGTIIVLISQERLGTSNSRSLDWIIVDEAKFINYDRLKTETIPAVSGSLDTIKRFKGNPRFKSMMFCTDMPILKSGQWIHKFEEQMDTGLIDLILEIRLKQAKSKSVHIRNDLQSMLDDLRSEAVFYSEASTIDNVAVVGEKYIRQQKRALPPLEFNTAILNIRPGKIEGGFYANLNGKHYYTSSNEKYLQTINYKQEQVNDCRVDGDVDRHQALNIALDYNANINWMVVGQYDENKLRTINSFFVKTPERIKQLVDAFHNYYEHMPHRKVNFIYDHTAVGNNYAVSDEDFSRTVVKLLQLRGWEVNEVYIGQAPKHKDKHLYISQALRGEKYLFPLFNKENNEYLIGGMEQAGIRIGRSGFEKDKSGEKKPESEGDPLELRTDGSDAWDTLFVGMNFFRDQISTGNMFLSSFM